jgi:hypothetical protein
MADKVSEYKKEIKDYLRDRLALKTLTHQYSKFEA